MASKKKEEEEEEKEEEEIKRRLNDDKNRQKTSTNAEKRRLSFESMGCCLGRRFATSHRHGRQHGVLEQADEEHADESER